MPASFTSSSLPPDTGLGCEHAVKTCRERRRHTKRYDPGPADAEPIAIHAVLLQQLHVLSPLPIGITSILAISPLSVRQRDIPDILTLAICVDAAFDLVCSTGRAKEEAGRQATPISFVVEDSCHRVASHESQR